FWRRPASEIVGKTVEELMGPSAFGAVRPYIETALRGVESVYEAEVRRDDGRRFMQVHHMPDRDKSGNIRGYFTIASDITELKQVEHALREREERMSAVLNTATDGIITFDRRGTIVHTNPAVERMFGHSHGTLVGKNVKVLMRQLTATNVKGLDAGLEAS